MKIVVTGGAGFIGSHLVDRLMMKGHHVTVLDNLTGGSRSFIQHHLSSKKFRFIKADIRNLKALIRLLSPRTDLVFHLAANADLARSVKDPSLDFEHSVKATFALLQAMRLKGIKKIVYTSGSGIYGDHGFHFLSESHGPLKPVSMYGASKMSAEGLISAFAHLYGMQAWIVRPANIIGPRLTHGVVFDFFKQLKKNPTHLRILGDGKQSKSYLHVDDALDAILLIQKKAKEKVNIFNLSSGSFVSVNEIANIIYRSMGLPKPKLKYTGGKVGWKGDVAIVRLRSHPLRLMGWKPKYSSVQAVRSTVQSLLNIQLKRMR